MKVVVLFNSSYPHGYVSTHRTHHLCKGLTAFADDLTLVLTNATEKPGAIRNSQSEGVFEGVHFQYIGGTSIRKSNVLLAKINDWWNHLVVFWSVLFNTYDANVVLVIGTSLDYRIFLPLAAKISRVKIVLEINEYPFVAEGNGLRVKLKRWMLFRIVLPLYNGFIVISDQLVHLMSQYKAKKAQIVKIPILSDFTNREVVDREVPDYPYIIHSGSLSEEKDGAMGMFKAFNLAKESIAANVKFVVTGKLDLAVNLDEIYKFINDNGLANRFVFTGFLGREELERWLHHATLAIINKYDTQQNRYCFSTKLADYLNHHVVVITTNVGESTNFLKDGVNAFVVEPGKPELLAQKIIEAFSDDKLIKQMAINGKKLVEDDFNSLKNGQRVYSFLVDLQK